MRLAVAVLAAIPVFAFAQTASNDFETERARANELWQNGRALEALPLYEDLAKRDPKNPAFAERHAMGLIAKAATLSDQAQKTALAREALNELLRARSLGDNSNLANTQIDNLQALLSPQPHKGPPAPPSPGYRAPNNPQVVSTMQAAEAAFARNDYAAALKAYSDAAAKDPAYYNAALFAGDTAFRMHDTAKAGEWFSEAIAIDPNRETGYRYWGDALLAANQPDAALGKFANAIVAEPYVRTTWMGLQQWSRRTQRALHPPPHRPASCQNAHTVAALADFVKAAGDPLIKALDEHGFLTSWILLSAADAGIAQEYAAWRATHRSDLLAYILEVIAAK